MNCTSCVAKTKALISFVVTAKLICLLVFAYAKTQFSHNEAHFIYISLLTDVTHARNIFTKGRSSTPGRRTLSTSSTSD